MDIPTALQRILAGYSLSRIEMHKVMSLVMNGEATQAQIGGLLMALRSRGESIDELVAATEVMRSLAIRVMPRSTPLIDTCGTGGSGTGLFNISTAAAFVVAATGGFVAKHGNNASSSKSGSANLLRHAGAVIDLPPEGVASCIDQVGMGFMFAPAHHSAMRHVVAPRRELGVRTMFNLLGPLANPAGVEYQVLGVFASQWQEPVAQVLLQLGTKHALVVHCAGLDEFGLNARSQVCELDAGKIKKYAMGPQDVGLKVASHDLLKIDDVETSLNIIKAVFGLAEAQTELPSKVVKVARDIVAFNAGAAIYVAGISKSVASGVALALEVLDMGRVGAKFAEYLAFTHEVADKKCSS